MSISFRVKFLSLAVAFVTFSCSTAETIAPPTNPYTIAPAPQAASETPVLATTPRQNDLTFIEFFAGT